MIERRAKRLFLSPPHMSGREMTFIAEAFASNYVAPVGPMVEAFEAEFAARVGQAHALAVSSGTAALHLALSELGVRAGDDVYCSSLTFIASVSPATHLGARPVFIDAEAETWAMDPALLAGALADAARRGHLPRAVVAVDLYGRCCDLDRILEICRPYSVPVVDDAAEALGATYHGRPPGRGAAATVYSFNGNKIITTSGGGMLVSDNAALMARARFLSAQAREPVIHYEHREIGFNYRMSNILAAIGRAQLAVLDDRVAARRRIGALYRARLGELPGLSFMPEPPFGCGNGWLTVIQLDPAHTKMQPEHLRLALEAANIESRPLWKPLHLQPVFQGCPAWGGAVSEALFRRGLCLPSGSAMTEADVDQVSGIILRLAGKA